MLGDGLYYFFPYQIFRSVLFRGGMAYLTAYFCVSYFMPKAILYFRKKGFTSDFNNQGVTVGYSGATPIMGGILLVVIVLLSCFLWVWFTTDVYIALFILTSYSAVGFVDDYYKVRNKKLVENGSINKKSFSETSEGLSEISRFLIEAALAALAIGVWLYFSRPHQLNIQIPFIPVKNYIFEANALGYFLLSVVIIVASANAVNMTDGLDSLVTVPLITSLVFLASVAYITGDKEWSTKLKLFFLTNDAKEIAILCFIVIGVLIAFLKFNSPPASIYMGDVGSLAFGGLIAVLFIVLKAELFIPIVGGVFFISGLSSLVQRVWFQIMLRLRGREYAEGNRFFFRAPYHHHQQALFSSLETPTRSFFHQLLRKLGIKNSATFDKYTSRDAINNKIIWNTHIKSIWLLVISLIIFFKIR